MRRQKLSPKQSKNKRDGFRSRRNVGQGSRAEPREERSIRGKRKSSPSRILTEMRGSRSRGKGGDYTRQNDCEPTPCPPCPPCISTLDKRYDELRTKYRRKEFEIKKDIELSRTYLNNKKLEFFNTFKFVKRHSSDSLDNEEEFQFLFETLKNTYEEIIKEIGKRDKLETQAEAIANIFSEQYDRKKYEKKKENLMRHLANLFIESLTIQSKYENKILSNINSERQALVSISRLPEESREEMRETLPGEVERLQTSLQDIDNTLDTVSQEAIRLIETNSSKENEIKELQRQLESTNLIEKNRLETTINALKQQNIELTARETSLSQQINNLVIEKDTLKNQLEEKQRLLAGILVGNNINEAIEQKDQEILRLKIQNEKLEQDIAKLKTASPSLTVTEQPPPPIPPPAAVTNDKFEKYERMKKMLPEGAVRQKMKTDGLSESEIDAFWSGNPIPPTPTPVPDEKFAKYLTMKSKGVPADAIKQKMTKDGISVEEIDDFFRGIGDAPTPAVPSKSLTLKKSKIEQNEFEKKQQLAIDNFLKNVGIEEEAKEEAKEEKIEEVKIVTKKGNTDTIKISIAKKLKDWFTIKNDTELGITDKFELDATNRINEFIDVLEQYEGTENEFLKLKQNLPQIKSIILIIKFYDLINAAIKKEIDKFDELKKWTVVKNDYEIVRVENNKLLEAFKNDSASNLFLVNETMNKRSIKAAVLGKFFDESPTVDKRIFSSEWLKIKYNFLTKPEKTLKPEELDKSKLEALIMATNSGQETYSLDTFKASCALSGSSKINELIAKNESLSESIITKLKTFFPGNQAELSKIQKQIDDYNSYVIDTDEEQMKNFIKEKFSKTPSIKVYIENCQKVIKEVSTEFPNDFFSFVKLSTKPSLKSVVNRVVSRKDPLSVIQQRRQALEVEDEEEDNDWL